MDDLLEGLTVNSTYILIIIAILLAVIVVAQFELSRRTSQRQLRAYVIPDRGNLYVGDKGEPRAKVALRNSGLTPARSVLSWVRMDLIEPGRQEQLDLPAAGVRSATTLAANAFVDKTLWFRTLSSEERDEVRSGIKAIYVTGRVEYSDVFRHRHVTQFRFSYTGSFPPPANATLDLAERGNWDT